MAEFGQNWPIKAPRTCQEQPSFNQSMVEAQALPSLDKNTVLLAYQLLKFHSTSHLYAEQKITKNCLNTFQFIASHYTDPLAWEISPADSSTNCRGHSTGQDLTLEFPLNWILESGRSEIRRAQSTLLISSANLCNHASFIEWLESQDKIHLLLPKSITTSMGDKID